MSTISNYPNDRMSIVLPDTLPDIVLGSLSDKDLDAIANTCQWGSEQVMNFRNRAYKIENVMRPFFHMSELGHFQWLQYEIKSEGHTGMVIVKSIAEQLFTRRDEVTVLDVCCKYTHCSQVGTWLMSQGYEFSPNHHQSETSEKEYKKVVDTLHKNENESEKKILVMWGGNEDIPSVRDGTRNGFTLIHEPPLEATTDPYSELSMVNGRAVGDSRCAKIDVDYFGPGDAPEDYIEVNSWRMKYEFADDHNRTGTYNRVEAQSVQLKRGKYEYTVAPAEVSYLRREYRRARAKDRLLITSSTRDDVTQTIMKNSLYRHEGIVSDIAARHILNEMIRLAETEGIMKRLCPQLATEIYDFLAEVGRLYCATVISLPKVIRPYQRQPHLEINIRRLDVCRFNDKVAVFMNDDIRFWFEWEYDEF
ncbi:hypothetical protein C8J55DRAFT_491590 [Lentinula edodes]|uniref:Uncharacterized protein n=1 Tax=Lentinula lateritia TaxID=40482 RepID=A0A9W9DHM4_9AGAR|nr:hypothetical protein C8J55DRAFT_491590 [Lentinula edodes]